MKRFYTLCIVLIVLSSLFLSAYAQDNGVRNEPPDPAIWMPDANLRNEVRAALRLNANEPLTQQKLLNLNVLNASWLEIMDITGLEYATNLTHLYIGDNLISDINPLTHLTNLRSLSVGWNQISNLTPLVNLTSLTELYIGGNPINDINPLTHLTNLRRLGMRWNQITDIRILADLVNLTYLRFEGNPITDTSPLENLPSLSDVDIEIPSLIPDANLRAVVHAALGIEPNLRITINAMKNLTTLNAVQLEITDLTGLEYATNLRSLSVGWNQISNLTPLANLTSLTELSIDDNIVSDISPLANLRSLKRLEARQNSISDIGVLAGLVNLEYLRLVGNPIRDTSPLRSLPKLTDVDVHVSSPPQKENIQTQGEPDIDPPQDDDGQSQQQQQPDQSSRQQQQQQDDNGQSQQQQQQQPEEGDEAEPESPTQEQIEECESIGGEFLAYVDGVGVVCSHPDDCALELRGEGDDRKWVLVCAGEVVFGAAPSHRKNVFLLDRITLEQLDPARLEAQLDTWRAESDGSALYLRSIALLESVLATRHPDKTHLLPNYPNPFNPETWIPYQLAAPAEVTITIYDIRGRIVRTLRLGHQPAGMYRSRSKAAHWDGRNQLGEKVATGVYFYMLKAGDYTATRKLLIRK